MAQAPASHPFGFLRHSPLRGLERRLRKFRLKQWHYTSLASERMLFACAIVDAGYVGKVFAYLVDRQSGQVYEWDRTVPLGAGVRIAPSSTTGFTRYRDPQFGELRLSKEGVVWSLHARLPSRGGKPALHADLLIEDAGTLAPVCVVEPLGSGRWIYTHKCYGLPARGKLSCGDMELSLRHGDALAGLDWNRGYRLTETYWNWAAAAGWSKDRGRLGFNLTSHRDPKSGKNLGSEAQDCAVWIGDRMRKIPSVRFDYEPSDLMKPWRIRDEAGFVNLTFFPEGQRHEDLDFKLVVSRFHQPYGRFEGHLSLNGEERVELGDMFGVTEQHFARW